MGDRLSTACLVCGEPARDTSFAAEERMFGLGDRFTYVECISCGTVQRVSAVSNLSRYYPDSYYSVAVDPERLLGRPVVRQFVAAVCRSALGDARMALLVGRLVSHRQFRTLLSILESMQRAGVDLRGTRVLDVGCGSGVLVYALSLAGVGNVLGIDPNAPGDVRFDTGARVLRRELEDTGGEWDLVMFHHSFEHLDQPLRTLEHCRSVVAPGGVVLIRAPTVSSWAWEHYGTRWVGLDAPRHTFVPSRRGMELLAARAGFRVERVVDDSTETQFWASEQYHRGQALMDDASFAVSPRRSSFGRREVKEFRRRARELNLQHRGDQAAFYLRPNSG